MQPDLANGPMLAPLHFVILLLQSPLKSSALTVIRSYTNTRHTQNIAAFLQLKSIKAAESWSICQSRAKLREQNESSALCFVKPAGYRGGAEMLFL